MSGAVARPALLLLLTLPVPAEGQHRQGAPREGLALIRVSQVGYLADAPRVAVVCSPESREIRRLSVVDGAG